MQEKKSLLKTVKGSYNPLSSSPIHPGGTYAIKVRRPELETLGNYVGPLIYQDDVVGKVVAWLTPEAQLEDIDKLRFALGNYKEYANLREKYRKAIQSSPFVQWTLIPLLLGANVAGLNLNIAKLQFDIKANTAFLLFLVQQGAKYKHSLAGVYGIPTLEYIRSLLSIYGVEATIEEENTLNLIVLYLTSYSTPNAFVKVAALLHAGANINTRIDEEYKNTILHYLIALEDYDKIVIQLIDLIENKMPHSSRHERATWDLDYTLQDKFGKTALLLAVGLNEVKVVEKLLGNVLKKNKKDIGLDIPDSLGRTPCMIAAALGHMDILKKLIEAGANCYLKDKQGRDLIGYVNASEDDVRNMLKSFSIHPERSTSHSHSYLYSSTPEASPVVLVEQQTGQEQLLVLSRKEPYQSSLKIALKAAQKQKNHELSYEYLLKQINACSVESTLEEKIKNQIKTRDYVEELLFRHACAFGDLETVEKIGAAKNFNVKSCDHLNRTPMHYAVMTKALVEELCTSTGYPRPVDECLANHSKVFNYLIKKNAGLLDRKNINGNTPLMILQRDKECEDLDTRAQAQVMVGLLKENNLFPGRQSPKCNSSALSTRKERRNVGPKRKFR